MALNSSNVSGGDDILANHHNYLIDDIEQHTHGGTDTVVITGVAAYSSPQTRYYSIHPGQLVPTSATVAWLINNSSARSAHATDAQDFYAGINLPHGAIITSFKVYWYREDASASGNARLYISTPTDATVVEMAAANSDASTGYHSVEDTSITSGTINNQTYVYTMWINCNPNDASADVLFKGAVLTYTITTPLP